MNVYLDITHTYRADLVATLISPTGTRVVLFSGVGGSGDDFPNITIDDEATMPIVQGSTFDYTDGDGFGDSSVAVSACAAPDGYVADGTDCSDASAAINPNATEICNDGVDDDTDCDDSDENVYSALNEVSCIDRDDEIVDLRLDCGRYLLVLDT